MLLFDGRGVAYSYESTVPAPLLPSIDQSYNPPRSYKAPPMADARSVRVSTHWWKCLLIRLTLGTREPGRVADLFA